MKYLLDTNSLNLAILRRSQRRTDICTIQEVIEEHTSYGAKNSHIDGTGIEVLQVRTKHINSLKKILITEGGNINFIRLFTSEGAADAMIVAYIIAEREIRDTLFAEDYTIITKDGGLREVARKYKIDCLTALPN